MFYEVRSRLLFTEPDEATDFYHDCQLALEKASVINPNQDNMEISTISLLENHHDAQPNEPCLEVQADNNRPPPE